MLTFDEILFLLSFIFTISLVFLGIYKGLNEFELIINIFYFITLHITFIHYIFRKQKN